MKNILLSFLILSFLLAGRSKADDLWQPTGGPFGGYIQDILKDADGKLIAKTYSNIYRSSDNGESWNLVPVEGFNVYKLFVIDQNTFLALTPYDAVQKNQLYRTDNNMGDWVHITSGIADETINQIVKLDDGNLYACCRTSVYKSTDKGEIWSKAFDVVPEKIPYLVNLIKTSSGTYYAASYLGLFSSTDNGTSWDKIDLGTTDLFSGIEKMLITSKGTIFVTTPTDAFKSTNNGTSWIKLADSLPHTNKTYVYEIANNELIAGTTVGIFSSTDEGDTWHIITPQNYPSITFNTSTQWFAGSQSGVILTNDRFKTIEAMNNGISEVSIESILLDNFPLKDNTMIIAGDGAGTLHRSTDNGATWVNDYATGGAGVTSIIKASDGTYYASSVWGGISISTDKGNSWTNDCKGVTDPDISALLEDKSGNLFYGSFSDISKSTDKGKNWSRSLTQSQSVQCNTLAVSSNGTVFGGTSIYGIVKTTDGGANWTQISGGVSTAIRKIVIDKNDNVYAVTESGLLYKSTDLGSAWIQIYQTANLANLKITDSGDMFGLISKNNILELDKSTDDGKTWVGFQSGLGTGNSVLSVGLSDKGFLYAGTAIGVYRTQKPIISGIEDEPLVKRDFKIYPNPASDFLMLNSSEICDFRIVNELGETVESGSSAGRIDVSFLSPGIYFLKLNGTFLKFIKIAN